MANYTESIEKLIDKLIKLPGIGRRSAERIVTHLLAVTNEEVEILIQSISKVKNSVRFCQICHNLSESDVCVICSNPGRNKSIVCVVERPVDVLMLEKTGSYQGVYHVLLGSLAPLEGKGPGDLKIDTLMARITKENIKEIIIATDSDTEGEATALYLTQVLKPLGVHLSRIGVGLPVGSNLEYADSATLSKALEARRTI